MKLTLAVDEQAVERAREVARQQGTSLNALLREYIELLANQSTGDEILQEFEKLWAETDASPGGAERGYKFDRDEIYEERLVVTKAVQTWTKLDVVVVRPEMIVDAIDLHRLHSVSFWDALVIKSARAAACGRVLSEDLNHGQTIDGVVIENPFR